MAMQLLRRFPIDFQAIAIETGLRRGKLGYSSTFHAWGIMNIYGVDGPNFAAITAPETLPGEVLRIENRHWCIYADPETTVACPRCGRKQTRRGPDAIYWCEFGCGQFDDDPDEGGDYSHRNPAVRLEREERRQERRKKRRVTR